MALLASVHVTAFAHLPISDAGLGKHGLGCGFWGGTSPSRSAHLRGDSRPRRPADAHPEDVAQQQVAAQVEQPRGKDAQHRRHRVPRRQEEALQGDRRAVQAKVGGDDAHRTR